MNALTDRFSKAWIYVPAYILFLGLAIWALYRYLNTFPKAEETPMVVEPKPEEEIPNSFLSCFEKSGELLGGIFRITPMTRLFNDFKKLDSKCYDAICSELKSIENGISSPKEFFRIASGKDQCFFPILNTSMKYHNDMVEKYPSDAFFYNSGQYRLSGDQRQKMDYFLNLYINNAKDYKLLIIGRASKVGEDDANLALSKKRSDQIIEFIENHEIEELGYDFIYFGSNPPQLNLQVSERFGLRKADYSKISYGRGEDPDFSLRLNQSVLFVMYPKKDDPFGLVE